MRTLYPENNVFRAIREQRAPIGFFNYIKDTTILDIAGSVGLDFVVIDGEHAVMDRETIEHMILAAQLNGLTPMVRMPDLIPWLMRNYMEMGAQAILIPHIKSGDDCRRAQEALRYPPAGNASCCRSIHADGYRPSNWMDYLDWAKDVSFVPLIEDPEGVEHIDEILDELLPGRDMVMFGKADYGQALGTLKRDGSIDPAVNEGYFKVIEACRRREIWFMACPSAPAAGQRPSDIQQVIDDGCSAVVLNTDQLMLADAMGQIVSPCRNMRLK